MNSYYDKMKEIQKNISVEIKESFPYFVYMHWEKIPTGVNEHTNMNRIANRIDRQNRYCSHCAETFLAENGMGAVYEGVNNIEWWHETL